ncbi:MAG: polymer-forming cytoskeletal protein [Gemmatimonadaceae bacterium]
MRRHLISIGAVLALGARALGAQGALPPAIAADVARLFNAPAAVRATGALVVRADQIVAGDVAVLEGPVTIAGRVTGRVLIVNGDVTLERGARIDGDLIVIGGRVSGQDVATIGGQVQRFEPQLRYHADGDRIVAEIGEVVPDTGHRAPTRWLRKLHCREVSPICPLLIGGSYNRVEGLPIEVGPSLVLGNDRARLRVDALGVVRTVDNFRWTSENLGHDVTAKLSDAHDREFAVGGRLYDVVEPTERWQLRDTEIGLASFFFRRDYRDYYNRHGGNGSLTLKNGHGVALTFTLADEVWTDRRDRSPFSLFSNDAAWRANPQMDAGHFHIGSLALEIDTKSDDQNPRTGWWIVAEAERGSSPAVTLSPFSLLARGMSSGGPPVPVTYMRGFLDLRRYNRLSPTGQLNMRLVLGGRLGGDPLPLERRLALGGPGTLPGFDFRNTPGAVDVMTCSAYGPLAGKAALCERIALAQLELRGGFGLQAHGHGEIEDWFLDVDHGAQWVLFGDMGRGWLVGGDARLGELHYREAAFPPLKTFQGDVGVGLDFNFIGFFVAKAVSEPKEPMNFFVRLRHRF